MKVLGYFYKGKEISEEEIAKLSVYERCAVQEEFVTSDGVVDRIRPWRGSPEMPPLPPFEVK